MNEGKSGLFCDFYELTMGQGFFEKKHNPISTFEMFYRTSPLSSGYAVFVGIDEVVDNIINFRFSKEDISYLKSLGMFKDDFLSYLENFKFSGDVNAFDDGEICFPREPLLQIKAPMIECCLLETMILNSINFQTLIATKASRLKTASAGRSIMEFGMRRAATGYASVVASRSAIIGGADSTSNTFAASLYNLKASGTMSHAWVMSFSDEYSAFRTFAALYPNNAILLIDTYDTLSSGIDNAIKVGLEQKQKGLKIGVRIDSGDLSYLSQEVRKRLDKAGLEDATICLSNDINESVLRELLLSGADVNSFGIGTKLVADGETLGGVYKMVSFVDENGEERNVLKMSSSVEKLTLPGVHNVFRLFDDDGHPLCDYITLKGENPPEVGKKVLLNHTVYDNENYTLKSFKSVKSMLSPKITGGKRVYTPKSVMEIKTSSNESLQAFDKSYKRLVNPHIYKVSISSTLKSERNRLIDEYKSRS